MSFVKALLGVSAVLAFVGAFGVAEEAAAPSKEKIDALVKDLGAEKAEARDRAAKELEAIGAPAVAALKEAATSDDPEVAWRARTILDRVEGASPREGKAVPRGKAGREDGSRLHSFNFRFSPGTSGSSVIITQDGSGRVNVKVTEDENGKAVTKSYEAETPEEFRKKYPEVAKQYGIGAEEGRAPRVFRDFVPPPRLFEKWGIDEDFFDRDWPNDFGRDLDQLQDRLRKQMDDVLRRHGMEPGAVRPPRRLREPDADTEPPARNREEAERAEAPPGDRKGPAREADKPSTPATLGVRVTEVEPALRAQLKLGEQEGVLVEEVQPGGRAAKAGLQVHDVIVSVGGTPVKGMWELRRVLRDAAEAGKGGVVAIEFIRAGERMTRKISLAD
jgi:hypothetical protein